MNISEALPRLSSFKDYITANQGLSGTFNYANMSLKILDALLQRWTCWCQIEQYERPRSVYALFSEHYDHVTSTHDMEIARYWKKSTFRITSGGMGMAGGVGAGDVVYSFGEKSKLLFCNLRLGSTYKYGGRSYPFVLRPTGPKEIIIDKRKQVVPTYTLVGKCFSFFSVDQLGPSTFQGGDKGSVTRIYI